MKQIIHGAACAMAAVLTLSSLALQAAEPTPAERYHYGMQLDVQKVLAMSEAEPHASSQPCEVVAARMDYLDSAGKARSVTYLKHSSACQDHD